MVRITSKLNLCKLKVLYQRELKDYILFNRLATLKLLVFAAPLLLCSIMLFVLGSTKYHIIPWHIISGITSLYFIVRAVIHQVDSFNVSNRTNAKVDLYLKKIEVSNSIVFQVSDKGIERYTDDKLEAMFSWTELSLLVEKERYFFLLFHNGKSILIAKYAVQTKFYKEFLNQAKKNIKYSPTRT